MITVGDRVRYAIEDIEKGRFEVALHHIAVALDVTAQRRNNSTHSSKTHYKSLLIEYAWLIEMMAFHGVNSETSVFGNYPIKGNVEPTFADLIYHVVRCSLVHDVGLPDNFSFTKQNLIIYEYKKLIFPEKLIWGLIAIVVFSPENKGEKTAAGD